MELGVEEFIDGLLSKEASEQPSDNIKPEDMEMKIPEWFDEKEFNRGRKFFWEHSFGLATSMLLGLVAVFSIPSILKILMSTRRSNSLYTAYRRYISTHFHTMSWFENDLKPGSTSWKSLMAVRSRHFRAGVSAQLKGHGPVSQRDLALTQFGFVGFSMLKPDKFGVQQLNDGDWEAYNHFWAVIGHAIGLEDKYNICRKNVYETREVCQIILDRVFTPCLTNVPEYFEYMARVMIDGFWSMNPTVHTDGMIYWTKYMANVPGYIYTEEERIALQKRLWKELKGKPVDTGVNTSRLIQKCAIKGVSSDPQQLLFLRDYNTLEAAPAYKRLGKLGKRKVGFYMFLPTLLYNWLGRWYLNINFQFSLFLMRYLPYLSFFRYGVKKSYVNMFAEDPTDDSDPIPNVEYYKTTRTEPWYKDYFSILW